MISGAQIRGARALLGWTATELSEQAEVSWSTIQRFESQDLIPNSKAGTLEKLKATLEAHGVVFLGDPEKSPGVQLMRKLPAKKGRAGASAR